MGFNWAIPDAGTASGRAMLSEQYRALARQIPILYGLMCANAVFLSVVTAGSASLVLTIGFPVALCILSLARLTLWFRRRDKAVGAKQVQQYLKSTTIVAAVLSAGFGGWALMLFDGADLTRKTCIALYIFVGLAGSSYCLQYLPRAGHAVLLVGTLPMAWRLLASGDWFLIGLGVNILFVSALIVKMLGNNYGGLLQVVNSRADITAERERAIEAETRAHRLAYHDTLTGLPNRTILHGQIEAAIASASPAGPQFGLLVLDLDEFKLINDALGHDAGDELLRSFASRLTAALGQDDLVCRLGGDEFAVLLAGATCDKDVRKAVETILDALRDPWVYQGRVFDCGVSIGASLYPQHGSSRTDLMKNADVALYGAKAQGRGNMMVFRPAMRADAQKRSSMLNVAKDALARDLIVPYYQPKLDLRTGRLHGFEALLRWRHPSRGIQGPSTISAAFEDITTAAAISERIIACVIEDVRRWLENDTAFGHVAINAAAADFRHAGYAERLLEKLHAASIAPHHIQLEITETVFLGRGARHVEQALKTLSHHGVRIALDDFGTGFASLSHLKQFPVNILKIDRSFVNDLQIDPESEAIIDAVISLSKSLRIEVVAEGIETIGQHERLVALGCDYGQGYLYSRAIAAARVQAFVHQLERGNLPGLRPRLEVPSLYRAA